MNCTIEFMGVGVPLKIPPTVNPAFFIMSIEGALYAFELATTAAEIQEVLEAIDQELD